MLSWNGHLANMQHVAFWPPHAQGLVVQRNMLGPPNALLRDRILYLKPTRIQTSTETHVSTRTVKAEVSETGDARMDVQKAAGLTGAM